MLTTSLSYILLGELVVDSENVWS